VDLIRAQRAKLGKVVADSGAKVDSTEERMLRLHYTPGSFFSRKVRIVLAEKGLAYEPHVEGTSRQRSPESFAAINPVLKVPVLIDGGLTLFESDLIIDYLLRHYRGNAPDAAEPPLTGELTRPAHHWEDAKTLVVLNDAADTMVNLRYWKANGIDVEAVDYGRKQQSRFHSCLDWLEQRATPEGFLPGVFSIQDIALICTLDYVDARGEYLKGLLEWRGRPRIEAIVALSRERPSVKSTAPAPAPKG
jgi:glutathione S-transferase